MLVSGWGAEQSHCSSPGDGASLIAWKPVLFVNTGSLTVFWLPIDTPSPSFPWNSQFQISLLLWELSRQSKFPAMDLTFSQRTICSHNVVIHLMVIRASTWNLLLHVLAGRAEYTETWISPYMKSEVTPCTSWTIKVVIDSYGVQGPVT